MFVFGIFIAWLILAVLVIILTLAQDTKGISSSIGLITLALISVTALGITCGLIALLSSIFGWLSLLIIIPVLYLFFLWNKQ